MGRKREKIRVSFFVKKEKFLLYPLELLERICYTIYCRIRSCDGLVFSLFGDDGDKI